MRYRVFRKGEYLSTGTLAFGPGDHASALLFLTTSHTTKPGDIVYLGDVFWQMVIDFRRASDFVALDSADERVQGLYAKACKAEMALNRVFDFTSLGIPAGHVLVAVPAEDLSLVYSPGFDDRQVFVSNAVGTVIWRRP